MEKEEAEYCEVCGNPFDERHARCPKCGKEICFDCKVKGKNRCVECEKKSINEYRLAFQQLLLTTNSNIDIAGLHIRSNKTRGKVLETFAEGRQGLSLQDYHGQTAEDKHAGQGHDKWRYI